mgnify:CR=1 FL=1
MKEIKKAFIRANYLTRLIYINLIVFTIIKFLNVFAFLMQKDTFDIILFLGLPADISNLIVKPWTIITYMFTHENFIHLLFNLLWLYFGGKIFLKYLNYKQLISTYFLGGAFGGLMYIFAFNFFPVFEEKLTFSIAIGASASVLAILIAISSYIPNYSVNINLIGNIKLKHIAFISIFIDILSIPKGNSGGHIAHLGGALYGFLYINQLKKGKDWSNWFNRIFDYLTTFLFYQRIAKNKKSRFKSDYKWNKEKNLSKNEIDKILDKISKSGYESLNKKEKEILFKASKK